MLELVHILDGLTSSSQLLFVTILAGVTLIIVNVTTHAIVDRLKARRRRRQLVEKHLKPLVAATADIISRFSELLILQRAALVSDIRAYDGMALETRIKGLTAASMNRHESTAYRLINFVALAVHFKRETAHVPSFTLIDRAEYFLQHKIAVGLKGNLYGQVFFSAELQDELAEDYLACNPDRRASDLNVGRFIDCLKHDRYDHDLFRRALALFCIDVDCAPTKEELDRNSDKWKHVLALAHLCIYLIDFYQEFAGDPQWEEHRLYLVKLVKHWNSGAAKHRYLYEEGDLDGEDYVNTFPAYQAAGQSEWSIPWLVGSFLRMRRPATWLCKFVALNARGARFGRRHHRKAIRRWGVKIRIRAGWHEIRWADDLRTVYDGVRDYLRIRLLNP